MDPELFELLTRPRHKPLPGERGFAYSVTPPGTTVVHHVIEWGKPERHEPGWVMLAALHKPQHSGPVSIEWDRPVRRSELLETITRRLDQAPSEPQPKNRAQRRAAAKGPRRAQD